MKLFEEKDFIFALISAIFFKISSTHVSLLWKFTAYTTSYIHLKQDWVTIHYGVINSPLYLMTTKLIGPIGGYMEKKIGGKDTIIFGGITVVISLFCLHLQQNIWIYYFLTVLLGIGLGCCNQICLRNICIFKPKKKGFMLSTIATGTTIFFGLFFYCSEKYINYHDYSLNKGTENQFYPEYISQRYQKFIVFLIYSYSIMVILSVLFYRENNSNDESNTEKNINKIEMNNIENNGENNIKNSNSEMNNINNSQIIFNESSTMLNNIKLPSSSNIKEPEKKVNKKKKIIKPKEKKPIIKDEKYKQNMKKVIKSKRFWRLAFYNFLSPFISYLIMANFKNFRILMFSARLNRIIGVILGIFKLLIAPIVGFIVDKSGSIKILKTLCLLRIIIGILMALFLDSPTFNLLLAFASEIATVGQKNSFIPFIYNIFGIEYSIEIEGMFGIGEGICNLFSAVMSFFISYLSGSTTFGGLKLHYRCLYLFGSFLSTIAFLLINFENEEIFEYDEDEEVQKKQKNCEYEEIKLSVTA